MNYLRHIVRSVLFCITAAGLLWGPGAAPVPIDSLVAASDGIVVGTITQGTVSGTTVALSVQVERALKGSWEPGSIVAATALISESWPTREIKPARGIFFLANAGTGPMRLLPVDTGYLLHEGQTFMHLPNTSTPAAVTVAASSPNERVVLEYLGVIEATPPDQLGGGESDALEFQPGPHNARAPIRVSALVCGFLFAIGRGWTPSASGEWRHDSPFASGRQREYANRGRSPPHF